MASNSRVVMTMRSLAAQLSGVHAHCILAEKENQWRGIGTWRELEGGCGGEGRGSMRAAARASHRSLTAAAAGLMDEKDSL